MGEILSEEDRLTEEFDPKKLPLPKDLKREVRQQWHFQLWLMQKKYREIHDITGFERSTIYKDIKEMETRLASTPKTVAEIVQIAMMSLRMTKTEVMAAAREAQEEKSPRWDRVAALFKVAADIDKAILQRFTQPALIKTPDAADIEKSQIVLDYIVNKWGPEGLDDFEEFYTRHLVIKRKMGEPTP